MVSVFPSFTYLTAAMLSFIVFRFTFSSALTPSRTADDLCGRWPSDERVYFDFDRFYCDKAVMAGGIMLDRDKEITPCFHWNWTSLMD